jgi:membrane protein implicated in regulation of membrane protease activity
MVGPVCTILEVMESSTLMAILWLIAAAGFGIGEAAITGTFFLLPFAAGASVAAIASFAGASLLISLLVFAVVSGGSFFLLKPLVHKLDLDLPNPRGFGADRLVGHKATVIRAIGTGDTSGQVKVGGEVWTAVSQDGRSLEAGLAVKILEVRGNRVVVEADYFSESMKELPS